MMMNCLLMIVYSLCTVRLMYTASILYMRSGLSISQAEGKEFQFLQSKKSYGAKQQAWQPLHEHGWKVRRF